MFVHILTTEIVFKALNIMNILKKNNRDHDQSFGKGYEIKVLIFKDIYPYLNNDAMFKK